MTIHKEKASGKRSTYYILECDGCNDETIDCDTFEEAVAHARNNNWKIEKVDGEWLHLCLTCRD